MAQEVVEPGSSGNAITLTVQNESAAFPMDGVVVEVVEHPPWVTFETDSDFLGSLAPGQAEVAALTFSVAEGALGGGGRIRLAVRTGPGDQWSGQASLPGAYLQELEFPIEVREGAAVAYIIDRSGSMEGAPLAAMKAAAVQGVFGLEEGTEVAVVSFAGTASVSFPRAEVIGNETRTSAAAAVGRLAAGGQTSIGSGLQAAHSELEFSPASQREYVVLSDGGQNTPPSVGDVIGLFGGGASARTTRFAAGSAIPPFDASGGSVPTAVETTDPLGVVHRIHTVAYGESAAASLLAGTAAQTGGTFTYLEDRTDALALAEAFDRVRREASGEQYQGAAEGTLAPAAEELHPFDVSGDARVQTVKLLWDDPDADLTLELGTPEGAVLTPSAADTLLDVTAVAGPGIRYFTLAYPQEGSWAARVRADSASSSVDYALAFSVRSSVQMELLDAPVYPDNDGPVSLRVRLTEGDLPVAGGTVTVEVAPPGYELRLRAAHAERILAARRAERSGPLREGDFREAWEEAEFLTREELERSDTARAKTRELRAEPAPASARRGRSEPTPLLSHGPDFGGNREAASPLVGARSADGPYTIGLHDDGAHDDGAPGDGVYGAVLIEDPVVGTYTYAVRATGPVSGGGTFTRKAEGSLYVRVANDVVGSVVLPNPALSFVAPAGGSAAEASAFVLSNEGLQPLEWTASADAEWLSVEPASGSVGYAGTRYVYVEASPALEPGTYTGTATLTTNDPDLPPFLLSVALVVVEVPEDFAAYEPLGLGLPAFSGGELEAVDYDGDGDLDLVVFGRDNDTYAYVARAYRNEAGTFVATETGLPGVQYGQSAWADYDGDGDLDLALFGSGEGSAVAGVFRNDGGSFTDAGVPLAGAYGGAAGWADYDGDGDPDLAVTRDGADGSPLARLYRNDGEAFTEVDPGLTGTWSGRTAWGDYDGDGDPDLLLTGYDGEEDLPHLYRNDGDAFVPVEVDLNASADGPATWVDYDSDGDLDLALAGTYYEPSHLYRNDGGTLVYAQALPSVSGGGWAWGDLDQDGDVDLAAGPLGAVSFLANVDDVLVDVGAWFDGPWFGDLAAGDLDGDGYLDLAYVGSNGSGTLARRAGGAPTTAAPEAPSGLATEADAGDGAAVLSWEPASDDATPVAALSYNVRVGTAPGLGDVVPPMALADGSRQHVGYGNAGQRTALTLGGLDPDATYYWSVQTLDHAFAGSPFATEQTFTPSAEPGGPPAEPVVLTSVRDGAKVASGLSVLLEAAVALPAGSIGRVAFLSNGTEVATDADSTDGWTAAWAPEDGEHTLTARAYLNGGSVVDSDSATITVAAFSRKTGKVAPIFECLVEEAGGALTARFGYENYTAGPSGGGATLLVPLGSSNKLTPSALQGEQLTAFPLPYLYDGRPGRTAYDEGAFGVAFDPAVTTNVVWNLLGRTSTAGASSKRCPEGGANLRAGEGEVLPQEFALNAAYPNPFSHETRVPYDLATSAEVRIEVYDVLGRRMTLLVDEEREAGRHVAMLDGRALASGVYLVRAVMTSEDGVHTFQRRITLVR